MRLEPRSGAPRLIPMDRGTKATLWITALAVSSYAAWFYADCAMDTHCHFKVCHHQFCGTVRDPR
jgi:hypothetical protein